jgi:hypothetical protein
LEFAVVLLIGNMTCAYSVEGNVLAEWWMSADEVTVSHMSVGTPPAARMSRSWVSWLALLLGAVAVVLGALALFGSPAPYAPPVRSAETTPLAPPAEEKTAGGADTCSVAVTATEAIARDRRPFLEAPPQWDDPVTAAALTRAQASALVELEAMGAAVGPSTPAQLAEAIASYRSAILDTLDADTRRLPAAISNAASDRASAAARKITTFCKGE